MKPVPPEAPRDRRVRVARIKAEVAAGTYRIDAELVAAAMLRAVRPQRRLR